REVLKGGPRFRRAAKILAIPPAGAVGSSLCGAADVSDLGDAEAIAALVASEPLIGVGRGSLKNVGGDIGRPLARHRIKNHFERQANFDELRLGRADPGQQCAQEKEFHKAPHCSVTSTSTQPRPSGSALMALPRTAPCARAESATRMACPGIALVVRR